MKNVDFAEMTNHHTICLSSFKYFKRIFNLIIRLLAILVRGMPKQLDSIT